MKLSTKILSVFSSAALVASLAAGCSAGEAKPTPAPRPSYVPEDIIQETAGIPRDTVLATVDGADITAEQLLYWVAYGADKMNQSFAMYMGGTLDWSMDMGDGTTMKDYILQNALETAKLYQVIWNHAEEMKTGFSKENEKEFEADLAAMKADLASQVQSEDPELTYVQWLGTVGLTDAGFAAMNKTNYLVQNIKDSLYGDKGSSAPTEEELAAWGEESGTLRAKHILVKATASEDGTDDGAAAALEKANDIRKQLKDAGDTEQKFDELMAQYSEDVNEYTGEANCPPEGYTFGAGEMVPEFEEGTKTLGVGQISEPIKSDFGYHIILRLDVKDAYANDKMNTMLDQWSTDAKTETTEAYDKLDVEGFYTKLSELRTTIQGYLAPAPDAAPAESGAPADDAAPAVTPAPAESGAPAQTPAPAPDTTPAPVG